MKKRWSAVAPLTLNWAWPEIDKPIELASSTALCPNPDWYDNSLLKESLSKDDYDELVGAPYALMYSFEAETTEQQDDTWTGKGKRSVLDKALLTLQSANLALWLTRPSRISFSRVVVFDTTSTPLWKHSIQPYGELHPHPIYINDLFKPEDFPLAATLVESLQNVQTPSNIWVAQYALWTALTERTWEVRYLFLWTGLEGLFGPDDGQELSHKIAQRVAVFLEKDSQKAFELYIKLKKAYAWRSKTVHGMHLDKLSDNESAMLLLESEMYLRNALVKILSNPLLKETFGSNDREEYLNKLTFRIDES